MKNMNNKPKSYLMIILGFLFLLTAGIVADTTNLYWTSFACLVISIIKAFPILTEETTHTTESMMEYVNGLDKKSIFCLRQKHSYY